MTTIPMLKNILISASSARLHEDGYAVMEQRNKFCVGDEVEIMKPAGERLSLSRCLHMRDEKGEAMESCPHPQQKIQVRFSEVPDRMNLIRVSCE